MENRGRRGFCSCEEGRRRGRGRGAVMGQTEEEGFAAQDQVLARYSILLVTYFCSE